VRQYFERFEKTALSQTQHFLAITTSSIKVTHKNGADLSIK